MHELCVANVEIVTFDEHSCGDDDCGVRVVRLRTLKQRNQIPRGRGRYRNSLAAGKEDCHPLLYCTSHCLDRVAIPVTEINEQEIVASTNHERT